VSHIVYGYVGAQDTYDEGDYINDLLMWQLHGMTGEG
jgi:hypothetical protein